MQCCLVLFDDGVTGTHANTMVIARLKKTHTSQQNLTVSAVNQIESNETNAGTTAV